MQNVLVWMIFILQQYKIFLTLYKSILSFLAGMLQVTNIVPLIEAATGEEVFTGEDLSDYERGTDLLFKNTGGDILATAHNAAKNATDETLDILNGNAYDGILTAGRRADAAGTLGRRAGRVTDGVDGRNVRHGDIHVRQTECTEGYGDYLLRECGSEGGRNTNSHSI